MRDAAQVAHHVAVAVLAAAQMRLHRQFRGLFVPVRYGDDDGFMFLVDQSPVSCLVALAGFGNHARLWNHGLAVQFEELREKRIVGGGRNGQMQREIGFANGTALFDTLQKPGVTVENRLLLRWRAATGGEPRRLDFERRPDFQHFQIGRETGAVDTGRG